MAKTLAGASDYAPNLLMNVETEKPTLVTGGRETERESMGGTTLSGCGDGETLVRN